MNKAVFLDKDGTLIEDVPYNVDADKIRLYPDTGQALQQLSDAGYKLLVISNQAGVALGYFEEQAIEGVKEKLSQLLSPYGVSFDGFYYCPHHPEGKIREYALDCNCRKPKPGMIQQAAQEHQIDLSQSWMVGDILNDVEAGNLAGCRTLLLDNGNETEWVLNPMRKPHAIARSMREVAHRIFCYEKIRNCQAGIGY